MKLIDLNYYANNEYTDPGEVINNHWPSLGYLEELKKNMDVEVVKHINYEGKITVNNIPCSFFKSNNRFWHIPFRTHRYIKLQKPGMIIIQGFVFPLQLIFLRFKLGKDCAICLQHHGELPYKGLKAIIQKFADRVVNVYSFAAIELAIDWVNAGVISSVNKCGEIMGVSTSFKKKDKITAKLKTGMAGHNTTFLWVGRLNSNKAPLTVLTAFKKYLLVNKQAMLYMIYQQNDLEKEVADFINQNNQLKSGVRLVGEIPHVELADWFSAADFYLSGSRREGCGYALIEAMSCGCIPIVTRIPSFTKITNTGKCGLLYEPGNPESLLQALLQSDQLNLSLEIDKVLAQFESALSFKAYANQVQLLIDKV